MELNTKDEVLRICADTIKCSTKVLFDYFFERRDDESTQIPLSAIQAIYTAGKLAELARQNGKLYS